VRTFTSLRVEQVRSVCWDDATHVIIFPSFSEFPDIHHASRTDLKDFVSRGNNLVFLGGFSNLAILNEIFGFQLLSVPYQGGPFYKSQRNSHNTPFEAAPRELSEVRAVLCSNLYHSILWLNVNNFCRLMGYTVRGSSHCRPRRGATTTPSVCRLPSQCGMIWEWSRTLPPTSRIATGPGSAL
jgi:hypothetical protein